MDQDRVWLVTGASTGLGRSLAQQILAQGARLVATARKRDSVAELEDSAPERALALTLDVTEPDQVAAAVAAIRQKFGRVDVLVNNAGYGLLSGMEEASDAEARRQFEVNFFGLAALTRAILPIMRAQMSGKIVNITSTAGTFGVVGGAYYCAAKFAVEGLSECLAKEVEPFGISMLIVEPGPFRTDFYGRSMAMPANPISAYPHTAAVRDGAMANDGKQPGDPERAAKAIYETVLAPDAPLRLVLGKGAFQRIHAALEARLKDIGMLRNLSESVDFPEIAV